MTINTNSVNEKSSVNDTTKQTVETFHSNKDILKKESPVGKIIDTFSYSSTKVTTKNKIDNDMNNEEQHIQAVDNAFEHKEEVSLNEPSTIVYEAYDGTKREVKRSKYYPEYLYDVDDLFKNEEVLLEGKNLSKSYKVKTGLFSSVKIDAVKDISFKLRAGETLSIVGESGSGKTTLAKLIANIEKSDAGEIFINDSKFDSSNSNQLKEYRKQIQVIFQNPHASLNPRKTIFKILEEPLILNTTLTAEERRVKIEEMIQQVGLKVEHLSRLPHMFSGGQKQRIAIARGLILNPKIVIADEAVSALDVTVQAQVLNLLLDLQKKYNLSYIFISHDLSVVRHLSHRIMVMYHGELVEEGATEEIFKNPKHEYTKSLIDAIPMVDFD